MGNESDENDVEHELRNLLLRAFADGEQVTGEWRVATAPDALPDWRVTVERTDASDREGEPVGRFESD